MSNNVRKAAEGLGKPPVMLGEPSRPGQVEGGNIDSVVISGEANIKKLPILRPGERVRTVAYRHETNEALFIIDEASAFNNAEPAVSPPYPIIGTATSQDIGYVTNQTRVLYFNGNTFVDVDDVFDGVVWDGQDLNAPTCAYRHYKFNAAAWRPVNHPVPSDDRPGVEHLGKENTLGDMCILVGECKSDRYSGLPGFGRGYGTIVVIVPSLLGVERNIAFSPIYLGSPITDTGMPSQPDFTNVELFDVVWRDIEKAGNGIDGYVLGEAYVVGTLRQGTSYIPKAYRIYIQSDGKDVVDAHSLIVGRPDIQVYIEDLNIETVGSITPGGGILFGCDFDDENQVLHVVGSTWSGERQIFASWTRTNGWVDRTATLNEQALVLASGARSYLIQNSDAIKLISNESDFIKAGVKRGQPVWVDITDWNAIADTIPEGGAPFLNTRNFCLNAGQSGLFFVQQVVSKTELILDKRMSNVLTAHLYPDTTPSYTPVTTSLFDWGFLQTNIDDNDTTIIIDVNDDMVPTILTYRIAGFSFITPPQKGDILTQAVSGAKLYVLDAWNLGINAFVRGIMLPDYINPGVLYFIGAQIVSSDNTHAVMNPAAFTPIPGLGNPSMWNQFTHTTGDINTIYIDGEQITFAASTSAFSIYDGLHYRRWTLTGCVRGANRTSAVPHVAQYNTSGGASSPWVRTICCRCKEREFQSFTRITDANFSANGTSLFLTGDRALMVRYDTDIDNYVDYRSNIPIPNSMDFGRMEWKPDGESSLVVANTINGSYVYVLRSDYLRQIYVPTSGIINDVAWTPDGLSAIICGKYVHKYEKKLNVELSEKEPKAAPIRYMFYQANLGAFQESEDGVPMLFRVQSDVLTLDDMDSDTLSIFSEVGMKFFASVPTLNPYLDCELRVFLSPRGDQVEFMKRNFWRSLNMSDTMYWMNPNNFEGPPKNGLPSSVVQWPIIGTNTLDPYFIFKKIWKLPVWARYIAVDVIFRGAHAMAMLGFAEGWVTVGVQGGVK